MKSASSILAILLTAIGFVGNAQDHQRIPTRAEQPKLIAVVNRANWCAVCKANEERFRELLMLYADRGVKIYVNDLTNDTTKAASRSTLQNANLYQALTAAPRKRTGRMLESCGLTKDKNQSSAASGIVTFIDPETLKPLKQRSIASSDEEMKATVEKLLK
ncbi:MAG TPA: hypothetical protein VEY71_11705 [Chitinophagales bacterium]|nr:hypothetical protein [Chitinophagales bacterium]